MTDIADVPWAERQEAELLGLKIARKHNVETEGRMASVDAIVELLDRSGVSLDGKDEIAIGEIVGKALIGKREIAIRDERMRILMALGQIGARLSAAEYAAIGSPSTGGWWFTG